MRNKSLKRICSSFLAVTMLLPLMACGQTKESQKTTKVTYGQIWSAPSSVKVMQEEKVADKGSAELNYQAVRNEYENCQLFITAEKDLSEFTLEKADLKMGKEVLSSENIEVYWQKYGLYNDTTCGTGMAPDALIPMNAASEHNENVVESGKNAGFWVTVYVPKETKAGVYEGTFNLTMNGKKGEETLDIPVSVEVFDYTLTDEVHAETLFSWRYHKVGTGELDASMEMMTKYYEFFLDYRISLQSLPIEALTGEETLASVLKYWDVLTSYTISGSVGSLAYNLHENPDIVKDQILTIATGCTADRNLFDKAIFYPIDEPNWLDEATRNRIIYILTTIYQYLEECVSEIKADKSGIYDGLKSIDNWEESILDIPMVIPNGIDQTNWLIQNEETAEGQALLQAMNCYCPQWDAGNSELFDAWFKLAEKYDIELWWYGCVGSRQPLPTYFIGDDNILSARTVSWMQKKYNIVGNLYWDTAGYTLKEWSAEEGYNPELFEWNDVDGSSILQTGDGTLSYPGLTYGVDGPMPSIRMMSIRDGMEEYELLLDVENALTDKSDALSKDFSVSDTMEMLFYKSLYYSDLYMYADGQKGLDFMSLRTSLLQFAAGFEKGLVIIPLNTEINGTTGTMTYYAAEGTKIEIDGVEQKAIEGQKYQSSINLEKGTYMMLEVSNAEGTSYQYRMYIGEPNYVLNAVSDDAIMEHVKTSEGSSASFVTDDTNSTDGTALQAKIAGVWTENNLTNATFVPQISLDAAVLGEYKVADLTEMRMDVYNPGAEFNVKVRFYSGTSYVDALNATVASGKNVLTIVISDLTFEKMEQVDRIVFEFQNAEDLSCEFYLDNIAGKK